MPIRVTCVAFTACVMFLNSVAAQQEEEVLGKKRGEWLAILKEHKEAKFRRAAVIALGILGARSPGVLPGMLEALENDAEPDVRREVATFLGTLGVDAKGTVDALAQRVAKDKNDKVKEAAARSLGKLAEYAAIHAATLGRALKDPSADTRAAAAEALKNFGDKAKLVLPQLQEAAQDPKMDRFTRLYAVQILARQSGEDERTAKIFADILSEPGAVDSLRLAAALGLANLGPAAKGSASQLANLATHAKEDLELRRAAAVALGKVGERASIAPVLPKLASDPDAGLRYQAARLAGAAGKDSPEVSKLLIDRLPRESNNDVLLALIQELGELEARDAIEPLRKFAADNRQSIREAAEAALKKIRE